MPPQDIGKPRCRCLKILEYRTTTTTVSKLFAGRFWSLPSVVIVNIYIFSLIDAFVRSYQQKLRLFLAQDPASKVGDLERRRRRPLPLLCLPSTRRRRKRCSQHFTVGCCCSRHARMNAVDWRQRATYWEVLLLLLFDLDSFVCTESPRSMETDSSQQIGVECGKLAISTSRLLLYTRYQVYYNGSGPNRVHLAE